MAVKLISTFKRIKLATTPTVQLIGFVPGPVGIVRLAVDFEDVESPFFLRMEDCSVIWQEMAPSGTDENSWEGILLFSVLNGVISRCFVFYREGSKLIETLIGRHLEGLTPKQAFPNTRWKFEIENPRSMQERKQFRSLLDRGWI